MENSTDACNEIGLILIENSSLNTLDIGLELPIHKMCGEDESCHIIEFNRVLVQDAHVPLITGLLLENTVTTTVRIHNHRLKQFFDIPLQDVMGDKLDLELDGTKMGQLEIDLVAILMEDNDEMENFTLFGTQ
jgi:hypothetical protein